MTRSYSDIGGDLEIVELRSPLAPGLHVAFGRWGGTMPAISPLATGKGRDAEAARLACIGEMVENLSIGTAAHPAAIFAGQPGRIDARAIDLGDPDDLGSEGCAAHPDLATARRSAVLERVERAALAAWWNGHARTAELPLPELLLHGYRMNETRRWSRCWRIEMIEGISTCLVLTGDDAGTPIVTGTAAASTLAEARERALTEALLAEVALLAPPSHPDHRQALLLDRRLRERMGSLGLLSEMSMTQDDDGIEPLEACAHAGHPVFLVDLTHPALGIPVWRAVCPSLPRWRPIANRLSVNGFDD